MVILKQDWQAGFFVIHETARHVIGIFGAESPRKINESRIGLA